ncbi:MAG: ABC transporter permease [Chloroflexi bacterium]|nr:MAG: ABC transporter permease [Chloroflexota bacterium]MBL1197126.1 ABC transporter permease [Chloroflexota bacterium]NOH14421.1 ABC transporter permease [Chloroflexota bacterium]
MIARILEIARLYLFTMYQSRSMLLFGFVLPLLFTFVVGQAIVGFEPADGQQSWSLAVVNADVGDLGQQLIERLNDDPSLAAVATEESEAVRQVEREEVAAALFIPADFSSRMLAGENLDLGFQMNLAEPISAQVVEQVVLAALSEVNSWLTIADSAVEIASQIGLFDTSIGVGQAEYFDDAVIAGQEALQEMPPVVVESRQGVREAESQGGIPSGVGQTSPGMLVIFTMFTVLGGAAGLLREREEGTLRRLLVMPMNKITILAGNMLGMFVVSVTQTLILILGAVYLFGTDWGNELVALAIMILVYGFSITGLAILIASLVRSYAQLDALSAIIVIPMAGIGGAMWPIEIVPPFMQQLSLFVPTGWAMRGFHDIITRGLGVESILLEAGVLLLTGAVFMLIGLWRFRYE